MAYQSKKALTARKAVAFSLFLSGKTAAEVAAAVGVAEETVWNWKSDKEFQHELNKRLQFIQEETAQRVSDMVRRAVDTLNDAMSNVDVSVKDRVAVAKWVLERSAGHKPAPPAPEPTALPRGDEPDTGAVIVDYQED
jgi:transposase